VSVVDLERRARAAWIKGYRSGDWDTASQSLGRALIDAHAAGGDAFLDGGSLVDETAFFERARLLTMRGMASAPLREDVERSHGAWMLALLLLLFVGRGRDSIPIRREVRGVPSRAVAVARRHGYTAEEAAQAYAIARDDQAARALVRGDAAAVVREVGTEARRAWNLGVAATAISLRPSGVDAAGRAVPVLWRIVEVMDARTRGNPQGIYRHDGFHWQVNGYANTMDEIVRQGLIPPCGVNCRATLRPVSADAARRAGLVREDGTVDHAAVREANGERQRYIDLGLYPDRGFR
jgi:hypothetical protein